MFLAFLKMIESDTTELKRELTDKLEREVVAFLNTKGGDILIGVDEVSPVVEIYSDHLSIVSYVGLVDGLSEEDFFNGKIYPFHHKLQIKNEIFNLQRHHHLLADLPMTGFGTQFDNRHIAEIEPKARRPFPLGRLF